LQQGDAWMAIYAKAARSALEPKSMLQQETTLQGLVAEECATTKRVQKMKLLDVKKKDGIAEILERLWRQKAKEMPKVNEDLNTVSCISSQEMLNSQNAMGGEEKGQEWYASLQTKMDDYQTKTEMCVTALTKELDGIRTLADSEALQAASQDSGDDWKRKTRELQEFLGDCRMQRNQALSSLNATDAQNGAKRLSAREVRHLGSSVVVERAEKREVRHLLSMNDDAAVKPRLMELMCLERECMDKLAWLQQSDRSVGELREKWLSGDGTRGDVVGSRNLRREMRACEAVYRKKAWELVQDMSKQNNTVDVSPLRRRSTVDDVDVSPSPNTRKNRF